MTGWWCRVWCSSGCGLPSGLPGHTLLAHTELLLTSSPSSLPAGLLSSCCSPHLYSSPAFLCPRFRVQHLNKSNVIALNIAQSTNPSRSLCRASYPSRESMAPQFFYQHTVNPRIPQLENLFRRLLWGSVSKALLKSGKTTCTTFPLSSGGVTSP